MMSLYIIKWSKIAYSSSLIIIVLPSKQKDKREQ